MLNDKWRDGVGEGIVRLLGRDGNALVQGAVNQGVEEALARLRLRPLPPGRGNGKEASAWRADFACARGNGAIMCRHALENDERRRTGFLSVAA